MPEQILTAANATQDGFTALQVVANTRTRNRTVFKLTTLLPPNNATLQGFFIDHSRVVQHSWQYTFPRLRPFSTRDTVNAVPLDQPIEVAGNVFHLNAMESVASAMEGSVIAGRNIAQLLWHRLQTDQQAP